MDLMRVNKTTFMPEKLIEGYTSLIWTERYFANGEFILISPQISLMRSLLPTKSLVTHLDTREVMMVDSHSIGVDSTGVPTITIKGRSLVTFADHRVVEGPYPKKKYKMARNYTAAEAASVILWNAFVNGSGNDVTRIGDGTTDPLDKVDNTAVTDSTTVDGTRKRRWLTGGQVYPMVLDLLRQNKLGIRTVRPSSGPGKIVSVTTDDKGIITKTDTPNISRLRWDIYNGVNRTRSQTANKQVQFHYEGGYMTDTSYLWDLTAYDTLALVVSGVGTKRIYRDRPNDKNLSGLDRRLVWVDAGEPGDPDFPKNATDNEKDNIRAQNRADFLEDLQEKADVELDKHDSIELFDGKIASTAPYKYGVDYYLGDRVTLLAEYNFDQTMRVIEYVRTEDVNGDVGYPTLSMTLS